MKLIEQQARYVLSHKGPLLKKASFSTLSWLVTIITVLGSIIAFLPELVDQLKRKIILYGFDPLLICFLILIGVFIIALVYNWPHTKAVYKDKNTDLRVIIECCDLLKQKGIKVIHVVDTFDTELGRIISPKTLHGAFLQLCKDKQIPIDDLINMQLEQYEPQKVDSRLPGRTSKYQLGTICPIDIEDERFCCVAFTHLRPNGTIEISKNEYIRCLKAMWQNLANPRVRGTELNVAVMGNRFVDLPAEFSTEQKIDLMIQTFFAMAREKACCRTLRICIHPDNVTDIDFSSYPTIIAHLAKRPII